jgi:hypothetical protein
MEGTVDVGYEISRQCKFVLQLKLGSDVGAYNVTFNQKAHFVYKVSSPIMIAYTIRKDNWYEHIHNP